ncbi:hypothetical protein [Rahnella aquatilis]|uniref:hypothetical protein n=1 Tax=Rahnella aquatilis TaxID=34038 RepID=UPI00064867DC|nr:hypothetical protein [Rahnella aquatilis]
MKQPPDYPAYVTPQSARWRRWWTALPVVWLVAALATMLMWPEGKSTKTPVFWFWAAGLPLLLWLLAVSIRYLVYQVALHNRDSYQGVIKKAQDNWWQRRSLALPVEQAVLIGSLGDKSEIYRALLSAKPVPPVPVINSAGGFALRCPLLLNSTSNRTEALARLLARQVLNHVPDFEAGRTLQTIYWHGDNDSLAVFQAALAQDSLTASGESIALQNVDNLDAVIDRFHEQTDETHWILCAGVGHFAKSPTDQPAGEAAFAWIVGHQGKTALYRPEVLLPESNESAQQLVAQLTRTASLSEVPTACLAMDTASMNAVLPSGWSAVEHVLMPYFGELSALSPFIAATQALLHSDQQAEPCAWMAQHPEHHFISGVTAPYGNV